MASNSYYVIEVRFKGNTWEQLGGRYTSLFKAVERLNELDLTYPDRIVKVTRTIAITEITNDSSIKRKRVAKKVQK